MRELVVSIIQVYNHKLYFYLRNIVLNKENFKIFRVFALLIIKFLESYHNSYIGLTLEEGAIFKGIPVFPHMLNGIVIHHKAIIGRNCIIQHQVTIAGTTNESGPVAAIIGDDCLLGAGCKIIGDVKIGNNVKIGANAVVTKDLPDNCTAVGIPAYIVSKSVERDK